MRSDSKESGSNGRKSSSPDKSLAGMKQRLQHKEKEAVPEERRGSIARRQSVVTNYDIADALRKLLQNLLSLDLIFCFNICIKLI